MYVAVSNINIESVAMETQLCVIFSYSTLQYRCQEYKY